MSQPADFLLLPLDWCGSPCLTTPRQNASRIQTVGKVHWESILTCASSDRPSHSGLLHLPEITGFWAQAAEPTVILCCPHNESATLCLTKTDIWAHLISPVHFVRSTSTLTLYFARPHPQGWIWQVWVGAWEFAFLVSCTWWLRTPVPIVGDRDAVEKDGCRCRWACRFAPVFEEFLKMLFCLWCRHVRVSTNSVAGSSWEV